MTQHEHEILQLAQRIQLLSGEGLRKKHSLGEKEMLFRLNKISELASALVPRIEANAQTA